MEIYVYLYLKHMLGVQIGNMVRLCVYNSYEYRFPSLLRACARVLQAIELM